MLATLLPGLREIRPALAAGFLWLATLYLILRESIPDDPNELSGPLKAFYDLRSELGRAGLGIVVAFGAYLLGTLSQGVFRGDVEHSAILAALRRWIRRPELLVPYGERGRRQLQRMADDWARKVYGVTQLSERARTPSDPITSDDDYVIAYVGLEGTGYSEAQLAIPELASLLGPPADRPAHRILIQRLITVITDDFDLMRTRLLRPQSRDLFSAIDRFRSEAELRATVAFPLAALCIVLAAQSHDLAWLAALPGVAFLLQQGFRRNQESGDMLIDAIGDRVSAPSLDRIDEEIALVGRIVAARGTSRDPGDR